MSSCTHLSPNRQKHRREFRPVELRRQRLSFAASDIVSEASRPTRVHPPTDKNIAPDLAGTGMLSASTAEGLHALTEVLEISVVTIADFGFLHNEKPRHC